MIIGIVGKPSSGKSTFFKAATLAEVEIANYPFTTIKPNHAVGFVKVECAEKFFNVKCNARLGYCIRGNRFVPVDMIDVAGLIPGAHKGEGLGLSFLNDLNQADCLIHVIDISGSVNQKGEPVEPLSYDPLNDVKFLEEELDFWYLDILKKGWDKLARQIVQEKSNVAKVLAKQLSGIGPDEKMLEEEIARLHLNPEQPVSWTEQDLLKLAAVLRKRTKPMLIAANKADVPGSEQNIERLRKQFPEYTIIPVSSESELALKEAAKHGLIDYIPGEQDFTILHPEKLTDKQTQALEFIKNSVLQKYTSTGVQEVLNTAVFELLKYIAVFPGGIHKLADSKGNILPDCFLLKHNSTALDFAYKVHTDIGDNFVKAMDVRRRMPVGREHVLKHLDVVEILTSK
ncbi:MAG: redox-regulated ATPase YchF [Nanoarchaeota archaeon]